MSQQRGRLPHIVLGEDNVRKKKKNKGQKVTEVDERLTDDDCVVVSDEHLAVDVDELRYQAALQLGVRPQTSEGDVVHPVVVHWGRRRIDVILS